MSQNTDNKSGNCTSSFIMKNFCFASSLKMQKKYWRRTLNSNCSSKLVCTIVVWPKILWILEFFFLLIYHNTGYTIIVWLILRKVNCRLPFPSKCLSQNAIFHIHNPSSWSVRLNSLNALDLENTYFKIKKTLLPS